MTNNKIELTADERMLMKKVEIKRIGERLSKKELCQAFGISYAFYLNIIGGRGKPSKKFADKLEAYLTTLPRDVYELVFTQRELEDISEIHESLEVNEEDVNKVYEELHLSKVWK